MPGKELVAHISPFTCAGIAVRQNRAIFAVVLNLGIDFRKAVDENKIFFDRLALLLYLMDRCKGEWTAGETRGIRV